MHLALTELDREARDQFVAWAKEIGCTVRVDAVGNIFARRAGLRGDLPPVMAGTHLDTQPTGGRFAGNCGVLAGLEVAMWTNEEGSRFVPVMMCSGAFAGVFTLEHALAQRDRDCASAHDALAAVGYAGEHRKPHAVGCLEVHPNSRNIIPGRAKISVDLRGADDASLTAMDHALRAVCVQAAGKWGNTAAHSTSSVENPITSDIQQLVYFPPQPFAAQWVADVRRCAQRLGVSSKAGSVRS